MTQLLDENTRSIETDETGWTASPVDVWLFYAQIGGGAAFEGNGHLVVIPENAVSSARAVTAARYPCAGGTSFTAIAHARDARLSLGDESVTLDVLQYDASSVLIETDSEGPNLLVTSGTVWETVTLVDTFHAAAVEFEVALTVSSGTPFENDYVFAADAILYDVVEVHVADAEQIIGAFILGGLH